jgi:hypothetical protein
MVHGAWCKQASTLHLASRTPQPKFISNKLVINIISHG